MRYDFQNIVITGYSSLSAAGKGIDPLLHMLTANESALTPVPTEYSHGRDLLWGRSINFKASDFIPPLKARKMDRCSQFAVAASGLALKDAGLDVKQLQPERIGIALGCGFGGLANSAEFLEGYFSGGIEGLSPMLFPNTVANAPASNASIEHGLKGPNVTMVQRFCSAESAFLMACRCIEEGRADVMLTGGADSLMPLMIAGFAATGQLNRYAAAFGEGCGVLVLEHAKHAACRHARIKGLVSNVATVGLIMPGYEAEAEQILLSELSNDVRCSLSGTAAQTALFRQVLTRSPSPLRIEPVVGRSLAMGGTALGVLLSTLGSNQKGLHLASSPEGPHYAISLTGGSSV